MLVDIADGESGTLPNRSAPRGGKLRSAASTVQGCLAADGRVPTSLDTRSSGSTCIHLGLGGGD